MPPDLLILGHKNIQNIKALGLMFLEKFVKGFYAVSTVFQLLDGDSSQIQVSWTIFNQYLTSPLS